MKLPNHYKDEIQNSLLGIAWAHWIRLGVYGNGSPNICSTDIEAAIILAAFAGTFDGRLFDGVLSWMETFEGAINSERLQILLKEYNERRIVKCVGSMIKASAAKKNKVRWKSFLNFAKYKDTFNYETPNKLDRHESILRRNTLIKYRYLFGTSARADILYLFCIASHHHIGLTTKNLVDITGYNQSSVFRIIRDLHHGGIITPLGPSRKRNTAWTLFPDSPLVLDTIEERKIIMWKPTVQMLIHMVMTVDDALEVINIELSKNILLEMLQTAYLLLPDCGFENFKMPPRGPLVQTSVEQLMQIAVQYMQAIHTKTIEA